MTQLEKSGKLHKWVGHVCSLMGFVGKKFIPKCMFCARQKDNPIFFSMSTNKKTMVDDES